MLKLDYKLQEDIMNIWLKEIDINDGYIYCELLLELASYENVHARPVPSDFSKEDFEFFKKARVQMAEGINLPKNVTKTSTYFVMNNDTPIGYATLKHEIDINTPGGHLGLCLKKEYQNKGIGTIVSELLSKIAYHDLGIEKLVYTSKNENIQSQKSLSNIGATLTGIHDGYHFYEVDLTKKYNKKQK